MLEHVGEQMQRLGHVIAYILGAAHDAQRPPHSVHHGLELLNLQFLVTHFFLHSLSDSHTATAVLMVMRAVMCISLFAL